MIDFVEEYMSPQDTTDEFGFDEQRVMTKAMVRALPLIMRNELTPKQLYCMRMFYVYGKNQMDIAKDLKLSQPTVSRHIKTAKEIVNKFLRYCYFSVKEANEQWLKLE